MTILAFYTTGDPTVVARERTCRLTQSDMYRIYAEQVGGAGAAVFGVSTDTEALTHIRAIGAGTLNRALFVGHGVSGSGGGYMFRSPATSDDGIFGPGDAALIDALGRALESNGARVEFHACNLGGTPFISELQRQLAGFGTGNIYAYRGRMFMRPQTNAQCQITGWTNRVVQGGRAVSGGPAIVTPDFFTVYPYGRLPPRPRP